MNETNKAKYSLLLSMFIWGTIGLFVKYIPLPSSVIAITRGFVGAIFLFIIIKIKKQPMDKAAIKANLLKLCLSGVFLGFNWILLFEAYRYTTVATATLCYYLAPVVVILVSPIFLKEKLTWKKLVCVLVALVGMVFVSGILGVLKTGHFEKGEFTGIAFGLGAACFYACIVLVNKKIKDISAYDTTITQLAIAGIVLVPYVLLTQDLSAIHLDGTAIALLAVVCIVHTGIPYALYFGCMKNLKGQTVAIMSYIDPVVAILTSALVLKEELGVYGAIGAVLVLGATLASEFVDSKEE